MSSNLTPKIFYSASSQTKRIEIKNSIAYMLITKEIIILYITLNDAGTSTWVSKSVGPLAHWAIRYLIYGSSCFANLLFSLLGFYVLFNFAHHKCPPSLAK